MRDKDIDSGPNPQSCEALLWHVPAITAGIKNRHFVVDGAAKFSICGCSRIVRVGEKPSDGATSTP